MDFNRAEKLLSRFFIRDLHSKARVPFNYKKNQKKLSRAAQKQQEAGKPVRLIVNKARRTGCSSWTEGNGFCHNLTYPDSYFLIAAHQHRSSKALFSVPKGFVKQAPFLNIKAIERQIIFPHTGGDAVMEIVTAGKDTSGRGFTLTGLHLSEAAHYKDPDIFTSIIPAVSKYAQTMIVIESTPKGMEGDGEAFYEMWLDAVEERSEYEAVFLSWLDDEACTADADLAKDAPVDDEEKELMKRKVNRGQLAWRRLTISGPECGGMVELFHQEYPTTWEESFVTSGFPAFEETERQWASSQIMEPKWRGFFERTTDGTLNLRQHNKGDLCIWGDPVPGHYYYIGVDSARGDQDRKDTRDFAAHVIWDGTTGLQAGRYAGYVVPEFHGCYLNSIGRHYNQAMINGEITGGYGWSCLYTLRDVLGYPNLYRWRGKHDEIQAAGSWKKSAWFETTQHTRTMLFEALRLGLREGAMTSGEFGLTIFDDVLAQQIRRATRMETGRVDVRKGHDDILFGAMLGNIALRQWAPPRISNANLGTEHAEEVEAMSIMKKRGHEIIDDACLALKKHYNKVMNYNERFPNNEDFDELGGS